MKTESCAIDAKVEAALARLEALGSSRNREGMARFAIHSRKAFGVAMPDIRRLARELGRDHVLADALWRSGWHEARLLATLVEEPAEIDPRQMDRWALDFENWADCDSACYGLFDRTPHAFAKVALWASRPEELVRRGAFSLLAGLAAHDRKTGNEPFSRSLEIIEQASDDERNFVWKAVNWALRAIGNRNRALNHEALALAGKLAASPVRSARWIGKDAVRKLSGPAIEARLARRG